ncbi:alpha/beta fold hydrolase [Myroides sp. WP-1]|uniref:alpha/beta fold hydrolase n=1 Tax=Myroides sp. WP-1 TaxID=2759944 RepID=UPI0015FB0AE0|nr:alpha/beta hydrolase [Myroides sp. WP-1]MBB1138464.1 alpha/beta hydrolase [Myroides sp. WP-1]
MKHIQTPHLTLCYEDFGSSANPCVLLLGGLGTSMTRWTVDFCQQLAQRGFYVIRYDHRDTGCSTFTSPSITHPGELMAALQKGKIETPFYSLYDLAQDAIDLLDQLRIEQAHIMGRSMGGIVAQILGSKYKERVLSLVIIMSTSLNPALPQTDPLVMQQMMTPLPSYFTAKEDHLQARLTFTKRISSTDLPFNETEEIALIEEDYRRNTKPNQTLFHVAAVGFTPYTSAITKDINCPVMIMHGTLDPIFPQEHALDLHASIPQSKLVLIDQMGHDLHPNRYALLLEEFSHNWG